MPKPMKKRKKECMTEKKKGGGGCAVGGIGERGGCGLLDGC